MCVCFSCPPFSTATTPSKVQVATKFYPYDPKDGGVRARTADELLPALDASLKRLQLAQVDLYQIHGPGLLSDGKQIGDALAEAVISGRCKAVGVRSPFSLSQHSIFDSNNQYILFSLFPATSRTISLSFSPPPPQPLPPLTKELRLAISDTTTRMPAMMPQQFCAQ